MDRAYSVLQIKTVDDGSRTIRGIASTPTVDRMGDVVEPLGLTFAPTLPLLWQHDRAKPVGTVHMDAPTATGIGFSATLPHITAPGVLKDRVDEAWQSVKSGLVRAVSIGFRALKDGIERMADGGLRFKAAELVELSLVTIPANSEAVITAVKTIDREHISARLIEARSRPERPVVHLWRQRH